MDVWRYTLIVFDVADAVPIFRTTVLTVIVLPDSVSIGDAVTVWTVRFGASVGAGCTVTVAGVFVQSSAMQA